MPDTQMLLSRASIVFREEPDGAFIFDPDNGNLLCLNLLGSFIWKLCNGKYGKKAIIKLISGEYPDIPDYQIRKDTEDFIDDLKNKGFLQTS